MIYDGAAAIVAGVLALTWGIVDLTRPDLIDRYLRYRAGVPRTGRARKQVGWFLAAGGVVLLCTGATLVVVSAVS